eukprot:CAMPEP_0174849742 /NCGR_PEP_ID=MMETSP1114-20130205/17106_1 /TAXON_ID=312471 /ORGANISM="Neobodo designis, Strain CCAP 1951/1" /LENGTH=131 /DNA_ID=CAMNT_0016084135 /DNA_START=46 /DNA_END=441 /DNA_ORIENTATION=+
MAPSKKADLIVTHTTRRAVKVNRERSYWSITPPPGCGRIKWSEPVPQTTSGVWGWLQGTEKAKQEVHHDADSIAALAMAWREHAGPGAAPAASRLDYQQLRNRKPKHKWSMSGKGARSDARAERAAASANL